MFSQYSNLGIYGQSEMLEDQFALGTDGERVNENKPHSFTRVKRSRNELVAMAEKFEKDKTHKVVLLSHGCNPQVRLEKMEEVLKAGPEYLHGFDSYEMMGYEGLHRYFKYYLRPLLNKCDKFGDTKFYFRNKNAWWAVIPANKELFDNVLGEGRGHNVVAGSEVSCSKTYRVDLYAMLGLRQAGVLGTIQTTAIDDFSHANHHHPNWLYPKHGHPYFRALFAGILTGATDMHLRIPYVINGKFTEIGSESIEILLHMIGKGILKAPQPEDIAGISPLGIAMHEMPEQWTSEAFNNHKPQLWKAKFASEEMDNAVLPHNSVTWGYSPTPAHSLEKVLFGKEWQMGYLPATPYGLVAIVPAHCDLNKVAGVKQWLHCDGLYVWEEGGERQNGQRAATLLKTAFEKAAAELPFRSSSRDVFFQTLRDGKDKFVLYAVGTRWFRPSDRTVEIKIQVPGSFAVRDLLSGESIEVKDNRFRFVVPAGSVRILTAERDCR